MAFTTVLNEMAHEEYIEAYEWYEQKQTSLGSKFMDCVEN